MRKFIVIAGCLCLLSGCAKSTESDLPQTIQTFLKEQSTMAVSLGANHSKDYYKYYLPLDMGIKDSTQLGEVFTKNESMILMNFDPSALVIYNYYNGHEDEVKKIEQDKKQAREDGRTTVDEDTPPEESKDADIDTQTAATTAITDLDLAIVSMDGKSDVFSYKGSYKSNQGAYYPYTLTMVLTENEYLFYLDGSIAEFYCVSPLADVQSNLNSMFLILKSISYDTDKVLDNFSMKNATSSKQQSIDSLQQNLPSVGSIPDLLEQMDQLNGK